MAGALLPDSFVAADDAAAYTPGWLLPCSSLLRNPEVAWEDIPNLPKAAWTLLDEQFSRSSSQVNKQLRLLLLAGFCVNPWHAASDKACCL
jgi:hypothetical protein